MAVYEKNKANPSVSSSTSRGARQAQTARAARPDAGARGSDPLTYTHRHDSMRRFAELLALQYDRMRTRQSYYRQLRLIADHFGRDPADLGEDDLRDYLLHVKTHKHWKPKSVRQAAACARLFFVELLGHSTWTVLSQQLRHPSGRGAIDPSPPTPGGQTQNA